MPGSSLWLVPLPSSPLHKHLATLITSSIPALYPHTTPPLHFSPHITLTADTVPASTSISSEPGAQLQQWLDDLDLPASVNTLHVKIKEPQVGEAFFRKLTLRCEKSAELMALAAACRAASAGQQAEEEEVQRWVQETYAPHASLMYSDLPSNEVASKLDDVKVAIAQAKSNDVSVSTAEGAEIWLVPTYKDIADWQPIARRKLEGVTWSWEG